MGRAAISKLPPPGPSVTAKGGGPAVPLRDAEAVAKLYRRLVLLVGAQILLGCVIRAPGAAGGSDAAPLAAVLALGGFLLALVVLVSLAVTAYRLMRLLGSGSAAVWAVGMFVPCINVLVLLAISSQAQAWCRRYGIDVGFLGPTPESLERIRRGGV